MAQIVAVVALKAEQVDGGAPIFIVGSEEEQQIVAGTLERIMDAMAHALPSGVIVLVNHQQVRSS